MAKNKVEARNREGAQKILSKLGEVRTLTEDMAAKRRLRAAEERLAVDRPVLETDVSFIDGEILKLLEEFPSVCKEGILTERYLDRMEQLLSKRRVAP